MTNQIITMKTFIFQGDDQMFSVRAKNEADAEKKFRDYLWNLDMGDVDDLLSQFEMSEPEEIE